MRFLVFVVLPLSCSRAAFVFTPLKKECDAIVTDLSQMGAREGVRRAQELGRAMAALGGGEQAATLASFGLRTNESNEAGDGLAESRLHLTRAQQHFEHAWSHGESEEDKAIKSSLTAALGGATPQLGKITHVPRADETCSPNLQACPVGWKLKGAMCIAGGSYNGPCDDKLEVIHKTTSEKLAMGRACRFQFPCDKTCMQNFRGTCPELWIEADEGICQAPAGYDGACSTHIDVREMSDKDKSVFAASCHARWPCLGQPARTYVDRCPYEWVLEFDHTCSPPHDYTGPCDEAHANMTELEKKYFEAACDVRWPDAPGVCERNYARNCPFGWLEASGDDAPRCIAPASYMGCHNTASFDGFKVSDKQDWESLCGVQWPCRDRGTCEKDFTYPCPADWFSSNSGQSCLAPNTYKGPCQGSFDGLLDLDAVEKEALESKCGIAWPCLEEVRYEFHSIIESHTHPLTHVVYSKQNGPIKPESGALANVLG